MAEECIFCKIVAGQMPAIKVYEDGNCLAFLDINPRNPGHTLIIPKRHYETILNMGDKEAGVLFESVRKISASVKESMKADGISVMQNNYRSAGQAVPHVHFHVIPRFNSETPPSLESFLPVKKMPEEMLNKIAETVRFAIKSGPASGMREERAEVKVKKSRDEFDF